MSAASPSWPPAELLERRRQRSRAGVAGRVKAFFTEAPRRTLRKRFAVLVAVIAVPAMAAPAEWTVPFADAEPAAPMAMAFETAGESFPGSAFYYLDDEGYVPLPIESEIRSDGAPAPLAPPTALAQAVDGGPAAGALRSAGSGLDMARAQQCLTMAIYYEAASEPDAGQRAVAQVVLNRVAHPSYPNTVCGVVFQGSERRTGCQFTFTCDGALSRQPVKAFWDRAANVARQALAGAVYAPVGLATHYHTVAIHPYWADSLNRVTVVGAHIFYRWKGAAGQRNAFNFAYRGGEPMARAHARTSEPTPASEADPIALAKAFESGRKAAQSAAVASTYVAPPAYSDAVQARGGDALFTANNLPTSGQVLPGLERSGQWLRQPGN
ncbi:cell wall hydrolase [Tsuneonella sp. HG222]